jgi:hypothetical protein
MIELKRRDAVELKDYSGDFNPDLKFEDFSKDFLIKLIRRYAAGYLKLGEFWYDRVAALVGPEKAMFEDTVDVWTKQPHWILPKIAQTANIEVKDIVDAMKAWQLVLDGFLPGRYIPQFDVKDRNHVIMSITNCRDLLYFQYRDMKDRVKWVCGHHGIEYLTMTPYLQCLVPNAQVKQLLGPAGSGLPSKEGICCQWEYTLKPK